MFTGISALKGKNHAMWFSLDQAKAEKSLSLEMVTKTFGEFTYSYWQLFLLKHSVQ